MTKIYKINGHLSLKLTDYGDTQILVNGKPFRACKYLLFNLEKAKLKEYDNINSIDEMKEKYGYKQNFNNKLLSSEEAFWGHCSNIEAWYKNDYDTRILHRNLAFPLLKILTENGDNLAKQRYESELISRFKENYLPVQTYLSRASVLAPIGVKNIKKLKKWAINDIIIIRLQKAINKITQWGNFSNGKRISNQTKFNLMLSNKEYYKANLKVGFLRQFSYEKLCELNKYKKWVRPHRRRHFNRILIEKKDLLKKHKTLDNWF